MLNLEMAWIIDLAWWGRKSFCCV